MEVQRGHTLVFLVCFGLFYFVFFLCLLFFLRTRDFFSLDHLGSLSSTVCRIDKARYKAKVVAIELKE